MSHKCAICDETVPKKELGIWCDECGMDVHLKCAGLSKQSYANIKADGKEWFCEACWAPCGMCDGDIFEGDKGLQCDCCNKWIHPSCCNIDNSAYQIFQCSAFGWICPTCNASNYENTFFTCDDLPGVYNRFCHLEDETNCSEHRTVKKQLLFQ